MLFWLTLTDTHVFLARAKKNAFLELILAIDYMSLRATILVLFSEEISPEILRLVALFAMVFKVLEAPILRNKSGFLLAQSRWGTQSRKLQSPGNLGEFVLIPRDDYRGFVLHFFVYYSCICCILFLLFVNLLSKENRDRPFRGRRGDSNYVC